MKVLLLNGANQGDTTAETVARQTMLAICNSGFQEAHQNDTALASRPYQC